MTQLILGNWGHGDDRLREQFVRPKEPDERWTVIHLWPRESECIACGVPLIDPRQGLPVYEGRILNADDPGEWGGFDCCRACFEAWEIGGAAGVAVRLRALREAAQAAE